MGDTVDIEKMQALMNSYEPCVSLMATKHAIYRFASDTSMEIQNNSYAPILDMYKVITDFGGKIHALGISDYTGIDGSIFIHDKNDFDVVIPEHTSPVRDNFTLAHELGHFFLHSTAGEKNKLWAARKGNDRLEWEANWFAAGFLAPEQQLKYLKNNQDFTVKTISSFFGLSNEASAYRKATYDELGF